MKNARPTALCVYCGHDAEVSRDHVVPLCLFTRPYPPQMITVPACDNCNTEKSRDDHFLRDYLVTDVQGSESPTAQAIFDSGKLWRSLTRKTSDLLLEVLPRTQVRPLHTEADIYLGEFPQASIDLERLERTIFRIVRGLYYDARRSSIPAGYEFVLRRCYPWQYESLREVFRKLHPNGPRVVGDVFGCMYAMATEDPCTTLWVLWFYERVVFTVSTSQPCPTD